MPRLAAGGPNPPAAVRDATAAYLDAQDALAAWLEERCERDPAGFETRAALFDSWSAWATSSGEHVGSRARFLDGLRRAALSRRKATGAAGSARSRYPHASRLPLERQVKNAMKSMRGHLGHFFR